MAEVPDFDTFLTWSREKVARLAPETIIFAAGGTRRSAVLAGISPSVDEYMHWTRQQMVACFDLIFQHGVRHIFTFAIVEGQLQETTLGYRERLVHWVDQGLSGPDALADYGARGWRVRLLGAEALPALAEAAARLTAETAASGPTLWWYVIPDAELPWQWQLAAAHRSGARTQQQLLRALYGEDVAPASLFFSFGKPMLNPMLLPPVLMGQMHCYWTQRPGYGLTEAQWRAILYDYAYLRSTWQPDKQGRAAQVLKHRAAWEEGPTLGLGIRLGPFWYPAPIAAGSNCGEERELDG